MSELRIEQSRSGFIPHFEMRRRDFFLRNIQSSEDLEQVYRLTYECYLQQGYCSRNKSGKLIHYPHLDHLAETSIFVAEDANGDVIGTCSTTLDNPHGLHVDEDFHKEADLVRQEGHTLASSWRIAVDTRYRAGTAVARLLVEGAVAFWHAASIETCLMTFNPCHERFYARYLGCQTIARRNELHDLSNAPAILMRWDADRCPLKARLAPTANTTTH